MVDVFKFVSISEKIVCSMIRIFKFELHNIVAMNTETWRAIVTDKQKRLVSFSSPEKE